MRGGPQRTSQAALAIPGPACQKLTGQRFDATVLPHFAQPSRVTLRATCQGGPMRASRCGIIVGGLLGALWILSPAIEAGQAALFSIERLTAEAEGLWLQGRSEAALEKFAQALTQTRESGERGREWQILDRMGRIYLEQDQFQPALEHF